MKVAGINVRQRRLERKNWPERGRQPSCPSSNSARHSLACLQHIPYIHYITFHYITLHCIHSFHVMHSFIHSFIHFIHSFMFIHSCHSFIPFIPFSFILIHYHSFIHSFIHSFPLIHFISFHISFIHISIPRLDDSIRSITTNVFVLHFRIHTWP